MEWNQGPRERGNANAIKREIDGPFDKMHPEV